MRWKHHMSETWPVRMLHLWMADSWGDGCRTEHVCREGSFVLMSTSKSCVSHPRLWWLLFLMEKLRNVDVHVMEKEKPRSCSHTFRCPRALPCDTLSINCSFEGKRVSSMEVNWRNDMPCRIVFPRSCGLKKSFVSAQEKRGDESSVKHLRRDPCALWGSLFACRLVQLNYFSHYPLLYLQLLACEQPAEDRGASSSLWFPARIHFEVWNSGRGRQRCRSGVKGWS